MKRLEWLEKLNASKIQRYAQIVQVLDTLTNKTTVYNSISEASRYIDCTETAVRKALKNFKDEGADSSNKTSLLKKKIFSC